MPVTIVRAVGAHDAEAFAEDLKEVLNEAGGIEAMNHSTGNAFDDFDERPELRHGLWVCADQEWNSAEPQNPEYDKLILNSLRDAGVPVKYCDWFMSLELAIVIGRDD